MAQPMHCDFAGCDRLAEYISSRIENGDTFAWCDEHWLFLARSIVAQADQVAEPAPEDQAQPELADAAGVGATESDGIATWAADSGEPLQPQVIEGYANPDGSGQGNRAQEVTAAPQPADSSEEVIGHPEADSAGQEPAAAAPGGPHVVKRGQSPSRRAYQARQRAKAKAAQAAAEDD